MKRLALLVMLWSARAYAQDLERDAQRAYDRQAIDFAARLRLTPDGELVPAPGPWLAVQDGEHLAPLDFYREIGRPDLIEAFERRRTIRRAALAVGFGALLASTVWANAQDAPKDLTGPLIVATAGAASWGVWGYLWARPQPIDEREAKALAQAYNHDLRRRLERRTTGSVQVAPALGGVIVAGTF